VTEDAIKNNNKRQRLVNKSNNFYVLYW